MSERDCCGVASPGTDVPPALPARDLACYCYEIGPEAVTPVSVAFVRERVAAGACWCAVKNPSGKCCLPDLRAILRRQGTEPGAGGGSAGMAVGVAAGGALVATAAAACCVPVVAPAIVAVLGVGGAVWVAGLAPFGPWVVLAAGAALAVAFVRVVRLRPTGSASCAACATAPSRRLRAALWSAAVLWLLAAALTLWQRLPVAE